MSRSRPKKKRKGNGSQIYSITHRLYKEIRENPELIHLKKLRGYQGEYNLVTEDINIDYRKMFFPTLIHEYFHKWNEGKSGGDLSLDRNGYSFFASRASTAWFKYFFKPCSSDA